MKNLASIFMLAAIFSSPAHADDIKVIDGKTYACGDIVLSVTRVPGVYVELPYTKDNKTIVVKDDTVMLITEDTQKK